MFASLKQIFSSKNKDLRKRIIFTLIALFIFKLGTAIIVPGIDKNAITGNLGFLEIMNAMGGGAMEKFSIFALGVMPYITASIIIQLLQADIVPYFSDLSKQGQVGRNKLNQITRVLGIVLAFVQGYMFSFTFVSGGTAIDYMQFAVILTAGTALLLWMGDQITTKGIGNGVSLIIMAGIIANMPTMFMDAWGSLVNTATTQTTAMGVVLFLIFVLVYIGIILGIIYEQSAERRVPIQYANKQVSSYGGKQSYIPFKLNTAGVIPVIFASALISIPSVIGQFVNNEAVSLFINKWVTMTSPTGFMLYMALIIGFSYFYTFFQLKPKELAENLNKNGGFIPGVRPGNETIEHISSVLRRITFIGSLALAAIAGLPIIFGGITNLPTNVQIGGTGLLIVVGVALETYKQIESKIISQNYTSRGRTK